MLHTLRHSPWHADLAGMQRLMRAGDALLLISDGVLGALEASPLLESLQNAPISLYALKEDIEARGLSGQISHRITIVDYTHFVRLAVEHPAQIAW